MNHEKAKVIAPSQEREMPIYGEKLGRIPWSGRKRHSGRSGAC